MSATRWHRRASCAAWAFAFALTSTSGSEGEMADDATLAVTLAPGNGPVKAVAGTSPRIETPTTIRATIPA